MCAALGAAGRLTALPQVHAVLPLVRACLQRTPPSSQNPSADHHQETGKGLRGWWDSFRCRAGAGADVVDGAALGDMVRRKSLVCLHAFVRVGADVGDIEEYKDLLTSHTMHDADGHQLAGRERQLRPGDAVEVAVQVNYADYRLPKGLTGTIEKIDDHGDAWIRFCGIGEKWRVPAVLRVLHKNFIDLKIKHTELVTSVTSVLTPALNLLYDLISPAPQEHKDFIPTIVWYLRQILLRTAEPHHYQFTNMYCDACGTLLLNGARAQTNIEFALPSSKTFVSACTWDVKESRIVDKGYARIYTQGCRQRIRDAICPNAHCRAEVGWRFVSTPTGTPGERGRVGLVDERVRSWDNETKDEARRFVGADVKLLKMLQIICQGDTELPASVESVLQDIFVQYKSYQQQCDARNLRRLRTLEGMPMAYEAVRTVAKLAASPELKAAASSMLRNFSPALFEIYGRPLPTIRNSHGPIVFVVTSSAYILHLLNGPPTFCSAGVPGTL